MALVRKWLGAACAVLVGVVAYVQVMRAIANPGAGLDFGPLRHAADAVLHGGSVYADPAFIQPPTGAVAALPLALGGYSTAVKVWLALGAVLLISGALLALTPWRRGMFPLLAILAALYSLSAFTTADVLWLGNMSVVLVPVGVGVLLLFEARRWGLGCALLVLSLLVKPVLLPFVFVPLLRRQWRTLLGAGAVGVVLLGAAIVLVPGGRHFFAVLGYLMGGGPQTGIHAVNNISIRGVAERLDLDTLGLALRAIVVGAAVGVVSIWARRPDRPGGIAAVGTFLLVSFLLVSSISEDHYLTIVVPCLLAALALGARLRPSIVALALLALLAYAIPFPGFSEASAAAAQIQFVLDELLVAAAAAVLVLARTSELVEQSRDGFAAEASMLSAAPESLRVHGRRLRV